MQNLGKNSKDSEKKPRVRQQEEYFHNNIFRKYWLTLDDSASKIQCNFIYPATEMLI